MIFVNLPVTDLARSTAFYEAIGGTINPLFSNEQATAIVLSDAIYVMLLTHDFYRTFTKKDVIDAHRTSGVLLAISCDSKADVDAMIDKAVSAGGKGDPGPKQEFGELMYGRSFEDPDGHHWEPNWMAPQAIQGGAEALTKAEAPAGK
ncbi:VOC family protein [Sphingomonas edaphi]|nr:VOC family protein [Sphingomonas edaphi]